MEERTGMAMAPAPAPADAPADALAELDRQMERGSLFTQAVLQRGFSRIEQAESLLLRLVDVLGARGIVAAEELGLVDAGPAPSAAADDEAGESVEAVEDDPGDARLQPRIDWPTVALRVDSEDDGDAAFTPVDCDARMHICHAVCCRLKFPLSCGEVDAGKVKWDIGHPYIIRHDSSGWCTHNDRETGRCGIYDERPGVCRRYSCAGDTRIWKDFEGMVLNQEWIDENLSARDFHVESVIPSMEVTNGETSANGATDGTTNGHRVPVQIGSRR